MAQTQANKMTVCKHEDAACFYRHGPGPELWRGCECDYHRARADMVICYDCGETLPLGPAASARTPRKPDRRSELRGPLRRQDDKTKARIRR